MVNHVIIERVRHPRNTEDRDRYPKLDDWKRVLEICSSLGFPPITPDTIPECDLTATNLRMTDSGLVKEGHSFSPYAESLGVCSERCPSCSPWPVEPRMFTGNYMNRCRQEPA
jgi:hypothetical protein